MEIERYQPSDRVAWNDLVRRGRNGTFIVLREYMEYHADRFVDHSFVARTRVGGPLLAVLPAHRNDTTLDSHGGLSWGGWVCDAEMTATRMLELFAALRGRLAEDGFDRVRYRPVPRIYHRGPADEDLLALARHGATLARRSALSVIDLGLPLSWESRRRRGCRRAQASGLECGESDDLAAYWQLLEAMLEERHGARPVHTLAEISALRQALPERIRLFVCARGEELMAGVLVYENDTVARTQYIASSPAGREAAGLDLLFDHLVQRYRDKAFLDLGTSDGGDAWGLNHGVLEFKESLGARLVAQDTWELAAGGA